MMDRLREFDRSVIAGVQKLPESLHGFMVFISAMGSPMMATLILGSAMAWFYRQKNVQLFNVATVLLLALPIVSLLKELTKRVRPDTLYVESMRFKTYSFPSGHAYSAALAFGLLAYLALKFLPAPWSWMVAALMIAIIILVGVSRVYLGAHFPTDVVGGWLLGALVLFLVIRYLA